MRFVADVMLARLARWLRLLGVFVLPPESQDDDAILKQCLKQRAALLTRDARFAQKAKGYVPCIRFRSNFLDQQVLEFCESTGFSLSKIRVAGLQPFSRCPLCNHSLKKASKLSVQNEVPPRSYRERRSFWRCTHCRKVYWKGSHEKKIRQTLKRIKAAARRSSAHPRA